MGVRCLLRLSNSPLNFNQSKPLDHETSLDFSCLFVSLEVGRLASVCYNTDMVVQLFVLIFPIVDKSEASIADKIGMVITI